MVNASKILTVSYGTFSCTLEGFDDPFSTMRSIAEYFRDLAADDRYFGAEPPTPDAEMLHRIAERENQRRVEARVQDNGVILRQVEDRSENEASPEPEEADAPAPAAADDTAEVAADTEDTRAEEYDEVADSVAAKLARIRAAVARSRTETEPLLNAVFAEDEHAEPAVEDASIATAFVADETPADEIEAEEQTIDATHSDELGLVGLVEVTDDAEAEEAIAAELEEAPQEADEADAGEAPDEAIAAEMEEAPQEADEADAGEAHEEAIAAELDEAPQEADEADAGEAPEEAIAAELDEAPQEADTKIDFAQILGLSDTEAESEEDTEETAGFGLPEGDVTNEQLGSEAAPIEMAAETEADSEEADFTAMLDEAVAENAGQPDEQDDEDTDAPVDLAAVLAGSAAPSDAAGDSTEDTAADAPAGLSDEIDQADAESGHDSDDAETSELLLTESDRTDIASQETAPNVRVLKMRREDFEARFEAVDEGDAPQESAKAEPGDADGIREVLGDTGLSSEDEEDLIAELAEVELDGAEAPAPDGQDGDEANQDMAEAPEDGIITDDSPDSATRALETLVAKAEGRGAARAGRDKPEAAVSRLLARADTALEESEGSRRRSAIAHLKAAVAAVRADGHQAKQSAEAETARTMDQFRDDLASVVRPVSPDAAKPPHVVPSEPADETAAAPASGSKVQSRPRRMMPPLMLVSEQRVDKADEADALADPVKPRRIQTRDLDAEAERSLFDEEAEEGAGNAAGNYFSDTGDFKGYVAETGAEGIQELLEASLAFALHVEGSKFNSRPQIMKRMLSLFPDGSVTREDGLRAFGVLLREGRIHRVKRGEFLLPESSRFHPGQTPTANSA